MGVIAAAQYNEDYFYFTSYRKNSPRGMGTPLPSPFPKRDLNTCLIQDKTDSTLIDDQLNFIDIKALDVGGVEACLKVK